MTKEQKVNIIEAVIKKAYARTSSHSQSALIRRREMVEELLAACGLWTLIERLEKMRDRGYNERGTFTEDNDYIDMVLDAIPGYRKEWE